MTRLREVHRLLLDLHRTLLALVREDYERLHGRVTGAAFLNVLTSDPAFAWIRPFTALLVSLDDMLDADPGPEDRRDCIQRIRDLLSPDENGGEFQRRYADALQQSPAVVVAHATVLKAL